MGNLEGFNAYHHDAILSRELDIAHAKAIDALLDGGEEVAAAINHALEHMCKNHPEQSRRSPCSPVSASSTRSTAGCRSA